MVILLFLFRKHSHVIMVLNNRSDQNLAPFSYSELYFHQRHYKTGLINLREKT